VLSSPHISFDCLAVVPVLIGPLQVLVAVLPPLLGALGAMLLALFKPAAAKTALRVMWRNKLLTAAVVGAVVGGAYLVSWASGRFGPQASAASGGGEWPAFRGGIDRRGAAAGSADPVSAGGVWAFAKEVKTFYCSPAAAGGRIFATSADKTVFHDSGAVYCLDAENGAVVWKYAPDDFRATFSSPAVAGGYVVVGEGLHFVRDGRVTCLEAATGKLVWQFRTKSHVESSPCLYDGKAYIGAGDDGLYCIALQRGPDGKPRVLWHLDGKEYPDCEASPLAADGKVWFGLGEEGAAVCCVDARTGRPIWRVATPYPVFAGPTLSGGKLYFGMGNGNYIDSAEQVAQKRIEEMRRQGATAAAIAEARTRLAPAGAIWALDPATGNVLAKVALKDTVLGAPAAADGRLYFGSRDGTFYGLEPDDKTLRQWNARDPIVSSPAVGRDYVYFVTEKGRLYSLDRRTFRPSCEADVDDGGPVISSPIVANGHIYVGSSNKGLLCLGRAEGAAAQAAWGGYLGGPGRSGWADGSAAPSQAAALWRYPREAAGANPALASEAPPALLEGSLYVGLRKGGQAGLARLALGDSRAGPAEKWFYPSPGAPSGSPVAAGEAVYFADGRSGDKGRSLHAVEIAGGKPLWKKPIADDAPGDLVLSGDRLLVCDDPDRLTMIQVAGGKPGATWARAVPGIVGAPAVAGGLVLVAGAKDGVMALDLATGNPKWHACLPAPITAAPVATEDFVAVAAQETVYVLSIVDGAMLWSARSGPVKGVLVCDDERVACTSGAGEVIVWSWAGKELLRRRGALAGVPPMLCGPEVLYATPSAIERVELASGKGGCVARDAGLKDAAAGPILANSRFYVVTKSAGLMCLGSKEE
jgi:outer membrane protein assembly factor BamB